MIEYRKSICHLFNTKTMCWSMIDAGKGFEKDGNKNRLREQDIHKIVDVFNKQIEIGKYSRMVPADRKLKEAKTANIWQNGMKPPCRN